MIYKEFNSTNTDWAVLYQALFLKKVQQVNENKQSEMMEHDRRGGFQGGASGKEPTCQCRRHKKT